MAMPNAEVVYEQICRQARQTALWASAGAVLEWDERTKMPAAGTAYRAEQITLISGMVHQGWTDPQFVAGLAELAAGPLAADPQADAAVTIRRLKRQADKKSQAAPRRWSRS